MTASRTPADRVMRVGGSITALGLVCTAIAMIPLLASGVSLPAWWWFASMLVAVGLVTVFTGLAMASRARARLVRGITDGKPAS